MNKFNRKGNKNVKNNVKEKWRLKSEGRRDRAAAREAAAAAAQGTVVAPKGKAERLSVSGRRTGKNKRKIVRKWQKSRVAAVESGAVSMEDIVMYAAAASERKKGKSIISDAEDQEIEDQRMESTGHGSNPGAAKAGFRVKPSKKARLRLKRRSAGAGGSTTTGTVEDGMEE